MITGDGVRRRALLGLPLVAALGGCGARPDGGGDVAAEPPGTTAEPGAWADEDPGQCVSLLQGYGPDEAIDLLDDAGPRFRTLEAAMDWAGVSQGSYDRTWGYAGTVGDWTLLWEELGYQGALPEVAARLSRRGVFACTYWNENVGTSFVLARGGRVVRVIGTDHPWNAVGPPLPEEAGLGLDAGDDYPKASALLVLLSRVTGTPVAESTWRDRPDLQVFGLTF